MARIAGVELPQNKKIPVALTYIYGIGDNTAQEILDVTKVQPDKRVKDLKSTDLKLLSDYIIKNLKIEGELKQIEQRNIKRLRDIRCYRGLRHKAGLPVRNQRTRTNARTRKGRNKAIALNKPITKK